MASQFRGELTTIPPVRIAVRRSGLETTIDWASRSADRALSAHMQTQLQAKWEPDMDQDTRHEIMVLTLGTLAALPVVTGLGLAVVTGILAW